MSQLFVPSCIKPIYLMDTIDDAHRCGLVNGVIYCSMLTPIILIIIERIHNKTEWFSGKTLVYTTIIVLSLLWILVPIILYFGYGSMWIGYTQTLNSLISQGLSRIQAFEMLVQLFGNTGGNVSSFLPSSGSILFAKGGGKMRMDGGKMQVNEGGKGDPKYSLQGQLNISPDGEISTS